MVTRKPDHPKHDDRLPGEAAIGRVYRAGGNDTPPAALDAHILDHARAAVQPVRARAHRWALPLSTAAVVVLAVGVVLLMTGDGALDRRAGLEVPSEYSLAPAAPDSVSEDRAVTAPARPRLVAPEPAAPAAPQAAPVAESAESTPAKPAPTEAMKKTEAVHEDQTRIRSTAAGVTSMSKPAGDVVAVQTSGSPGAYEFNVTVKSPDTGCQQYADWWEVVSTDGKLLYRRVLLHSHVTEQPFTRSGGPVPIQADTIVWVRAHMNTGGYGGMAFKGSVRSGFKPAALNPGFSAGLASQPPLPDDCDF